MQGTQIAFEFRLSFQLTDFFSLLAEFFRGFFVLFFLLDYEFTGILPQFLKKRVSTLIIFLNLGDLSIGF